MPEWIVALSALANVALVVALVLVTRRYANETKDIADATREQAKASAKMAEEMREQAEASVRMAEEMREQAEASVRMAAVTEASRLGAFQPRLTLGTSGGRGSEPPEVIATVVNRGNGPALNVRMTILHHRFDFREKRITEIAPGPARRETLDSTTRGDDAGSPNVPVLLVADYQDLEGNWYQTTLELDMPGAAVDKHGKMSFRGTSREAFRKELANDS
jgi:Sec-independent protein translocase protein TatA